MNGSLLHSENDEPFFLRMVTRPSQFPPDGLDLGVMEVCHVRCPQGEVYPAAESYFCFLAWGISGRFSVYVDEVKYSVQGGEFLLLEPGGTFRVEADKEENQGYYLFLDGPQAQKVIQQIGFWSAVFPYARSPHTCLDQIAQDIEFLKKQEHLAMIGHGLLVTAYRDAFQCAPDKMVWDACCYLHKNWDSPGMNVESVLRHLDVSRSTLSPRFRKMAGKSILDYLMEIRYRNALKMLTSDHISVSKIALRCGFPDVSYFSTWFRKRNGQSPRALKKEMAQ